MKRVAHFAMIASAILCLVGHPVWHAVAQTEEAVQVTKEVIPLQPSVAMK